MPKEFVIIKLEKPTDSTIKNVLCRLLKKELSRDEVYDWFIEISNQYSTTHGGWIDYEAGSNESYFAIQSLQFIKQKGLYKHDNPQDFFIRDNDIEEYIFEINLVDSIEKNGDIHRIRTHQDLERNQKRHYLVSINSNAEDVTKKFGVDFKRGWTNDLCVPTIYAIIKYKKAYFFLELMCSNEYWLSIRGTQGGDYELAGLLGDAEITTDLLYGYNKDVLQGYTQLWRLDDNGNEFLVKKCETVLEALLLKKEYERHGHKQTYFTKNA